MPKVFLTDKFIPFNLKRIIILTDIDIIERNLYICNVAVATLVSLQFYIE